jgi:ribonuclease HI
MNANDNSTNGRLRILQINLNKSPHAHLDLINNVNSASWDIILIQEPHTTFFANIRTPNHYISVSPTSHFKLQDPIRAVTWISSKISSNSWKIINMPDTNDVTAIQFTGAFGRLTIFNIYNAGEHNDTIARLNQFMNSQRETLCVNDNDYVIWAGDFNRHHPLWDNDEDERLFTNDALADADILINRLADWNMDMPLPKGIPTLKHMVTKKYSRTDNVFCTDNLTGFVTKCDTLPHLQPTKTDHFPITTTLQLPTEHVIPKPSKNFRMTDWKEFNEQLELELINVGPPRTITTEIQFHETIASLTKAIQNTIRDKVPTNKPCPHSKRWWNLELKTMKKELCKLSHHSHKFRALPDHPSHQELKEARDKYAEEITKAKTQHWATYLEDATEEQLWTANKYLAEPVGDGGRTRIPTLKVASENGQTTEASSNDEKANALAKSFFPEKPNRDLVPPNADYPEPVQFSPSYGRDRIRAGIAKLTPYKASGPDDIPNIVLQRAAHQLVDYLFYIYQATFTLNVYHHQWREFTTAVLRKPGKPNYEVPKAYRPIALLCTMAKVLTALVAEDILHITEKHGLLPNTHFGGRPGRSTTDAIHLLVHKIKSAWRQRKVVSVLFLDIEGAFPNAVNSRLIHNMRKRRIPQVYTNFIGNLLHSRSTRLKFDDFVSEPIQIDNGIGQGDPISMLVYLYYNADMLDIAESEDESLAAFVDDTLAAVAGDSFEDTTRGLQHIMDREGGGFEWGDNHNSNFEIDKLAVMHCTTKRLRDPNDPNQSIPLPRPELRLRNQVIREVESYKYLGVMIDNKLRWGIQGQRAAAKATQFILMFRRLTHPSTGIHAKLMRQLYLSVAIPKMTYGADVWYTPPRLEMGKRRRTGSVGVLRLLEKVQRIAVIAINGALRTTANDTLNAHANIMPVDLMLEKICYRGLIRICSLPETHPLCNLIQDYFDKPTRKQPTPLHNLLRIFNIDPRLVETISPPIRPPTHRNVFITEMATNRDDSIAVEAADDAEIKVFVDSSGLDGQAGASAVLYRKGRENPEKILRYHLGTLDTHTNYEAEGVALLMAIWLLRNQHVLGNLFVTIYIDSQAIVKAINANKSRPGQYLIESIIRLVEHFYQNRNRDRLRIRWISAHSDVVGNERADEEAKRAAQGESTPVQFLPPLLRHPLPYSVSALKQNHLKKLRSQWLEKWKTSPRYDKISRFDDSLPMSNFAKICEGLTRAQRSLLVQIRTGHVPLNKYLFQIKRADTDKCTACTQITGQQVTETVKHFLFECPAYHQQRHVLDVKLGRNSRDLQSIFQNVDHTKALIRYIAQTGRLKRTFGNMLDVEKEK